MFMVRARTTATTSPSSPATREDPWRATSSRTSTPSHPRAARVPSCTSPTSARSPAPRRGWRAPCCPASSHLGRDAGYDTASLNVDTANPTGALGIYERAGFRQSYRQDAYTLEE